MSYKIYAFFDLRSYLRNVHTPKLQIFPQSWQSRPKVHDFDVINSATNAQFWITSAEGVCAASQGELSLKKRGGTVDSARPE